MTAFLGGHLGEHLGAAGIFRSEAFRDVEVDATVLFLIGDRKGEDFAFGQVGEIAHGAQIGRDRRSVKWRA